MSEGIQFKTLDKIEKDFRGLIDGVKDLHGKMAKAAGIESATVRCEICGKSRKVKGTVRRVKEGT